MEAVTTENMLTRGKIKLLALTLRKQVPDFKAYAVTANFPTALNYEYYVDEHGTMYASV